jgi:addiction module RelB/DinJ family antitoxin
MPTKTITKKTKVIQTRLDADLVDRANEILDYIGLSATDVVWILLKNIVNTGTLPLDLSFPINRIPTNIPTLKLSPEDTYRIEKTLDDYHSRKLKTTKISNKSKN